MKTTDELLESSDDTALKIIVILLPPSEGGVSGNYNWNGWVSYFNSIKKNHPSFEGFAIDDFNAMSLNIGLKFKNNLRYMLYSNLSDALYHKRNDVGFYPVVYFEGQGIRTIIKEYAKFVDGIITVSISPNSVLHLEENLKEMGRLFNGEPIRYIIYPNAIEGQETVAALSIASRASTGVIIYSEVDNPIILNYLYNKEDVLYLSRFHLTEKQQIDNELLSLRRDIVFYAPICMAGITSPKLVVSDLPN